MWPARASQTAPSKTHAASGQDAGALFLQGQAALQKGELDAAEEAFQRVLDVDPRAGGAYANLGVIAMRRKEWDHALKLLTRAEALEPKVPGIRLNIGLVKYRRGDYQGAIAPFASVVRDQPDSQQARYLLALSDLFTERYSDAFSALEPLWTEMSSNIMYLYVFSMAANKSGEKETEEKALARLVDIGGDRPEFHLLLGKAYLNRRETQKAVAELERAASLNPNLPFVHLNLGIAYMRTGETNRAEEEFRTDIQIEPDVPDTYELQGEYYLRAANNVEAEKCFHEALKRNAGMVEAQIGLAKAYFGEGQYKQALASIDEALRRGSNAQSAHYLRGKILTKLGRREEGQKEMVMASRMGDAAEGKEQDAFDENRVPNPELAEPPR